MEFPKIKSGSGEFKAGFSKCNVQFVKVHVHFGTFKKGSGGSQAVRRNRYRFPADLMCQLSEKEVIELNRSQIVTGSQKAMTKPGRERKEIGFRSG